MTLKLIGRSFNPNLEVRRVALSSLPDVRDVRCRNVFLNLQRRLRDLQRNDSKIEEELVFKWFFRQWFRAMECRGCALGFYWRPERAVLPMNASSPPSKALRCRIMGICHRYGTSWHPWLAQVLKESLEISTNLAESPKTNYPYSVRLNL